VGRYRNWCSAGYNSMPLWSRSGSAVICARDSQRAAVDGYEWVVKSRKLKIVANLSATNEPAAVYAQGPRHYAICDSWSERARIAPEADIVIIFMRIRRVRPHTIRSNYKKEKKRIAGAGHLRAQWRKTTSQPLQIRLYSQQLS
jgi:hypothetical protein